MAPLAGLRQTIYDEHISHLKETDDGVKFRHGAYFYYHRTVKGQSYALHARVPAGGIEDRAPAPDAVEEILLDENKLAVGKSHCDVRSVRVSPNHTMLAYCVDYTGDEVFELVVIDLATGAVLDSVQEVASDLVWGDDSTLFYVTQDAQLRPFRMWRHTIGTDHAADAMLFEERDEMFELGMSKSSSGRFIFAYSGSSETSEWAFLDLNAEGALLATTLTMVQKRAFGLRYDLEHDGADGFLVWTNKDDAINNRLMRAPIASPSCSEWAEVIEYDDTRKVDDVSVFDTFVVMEGRQAGLTQIWLMGKDSVSGRVDAASLRRISFDEELYEVAVSVNMDYATPFVRISYSSLCTPYQWLDMDMRDPSRKLLIKEQPVLNFNRSLYICQRIFATAPDKTKIPMSIVHRKDLYDSHNGTISKKAKTHKKQKNKKAKKQKSKKTKKQKNKKAKR